MVTCVQAPPPGVRPDGSAQPREAGSQPPEAQPEANGNLASGDLSDGVSDAATGSCQTQTC